MSNATLEKTAAESVRHNEQKWSKALMAAGWTALPSIITEKQAALGLDAIDMNIILHLSSYWWTADNLPHPSVPKIAAAVGVTTRTVQKRIKAMTQLGLMTRHQRRHTQRGSDTNLYGFAGLIEAATPHALEKAARNAERREQEKQRVARKRPNLTVVSDA